MGGLSTHRCLPLCCDPDNARMLQSEVTAFVRLSSADAAFDEIMAHRRPSASATMAASHD